MSFCTKCGQRLEDGENKCPYCGEIVTQAAEDKTQVFEDKQNIKFIEKLKNNKRKLIIIISVLILCLVFGGIGIAKYTKASQIKEGITLGNKYLQEQKYEEAILAFQKVIKVDPKNVEARVGLAKAYIKTGKTEEAEKVLKEAVGINPKKVEPYLELAKLYVSEKKPIYAIKILTDGFKSTNYESIKAMLDELKSKITVDNISKTITSGEKYSLPKEVTAKINDVKVQFPVEWDKTTVDTVKVGTQTFNGILEDTDKKVKLTLNIITIASIGDINNTINQNDNYTLPSKVTAKMTDGSTQQVQVTWSPSSVDTSKTGTYTYQGTVSGYKSKIKLTLTVNCNITKEQAIELVRAYEKTQNIQYEYEIIENKADQTALIEDGSNITGHDCYFFVFKGGNACGYLVDKTTGKLYLGEAEDVEKQYFRLIR